MADLLRYCADLPIVQVPAGECVVQQGRDAEAMYILIDGAVQMERDGIAFATVTYPGAVFGDMSRCCSGSRPRRRARWCPAGCTSPATRWRCWNNVPK